MIVALKYLTGVGIKEVVFLSKLMDIFIK